jgi:hypothetical protein
VTATATANTTTAKTKTKNNNNKLLQNIFFLPKLICLSLMNYDNNNKNYNIKQLSFTQLLITHRLFSASYCNLINVVKSQQMIIIFN